MDSDYIVILIDGRFKLYSSPSSVSTHAFIKSSFSSQKLNIDFARSPFSSSTNFLDHNSLLSIGKCNNENIKEKNLYLLSHKLCENLSDENDIKNLTKRLTDWMNISFHPNVLKPLNFSGQSDLLFELPSLITLRDWINRGNGFLYEDFPFESTRKIFNIAIQITEGLIHIHGHKFISQDLKPENIWIFNENQIKIGNFFLFPSGEYQSYSCKIGFAGGSPFYWSYEQGANFEAFLENPNLFLPLDLDSSCDIYSFGLILKEILFGGKRPWRLGHKIDHIIGENQYYSKKILGKAINVLGKLADRCLKKKPSERITAKKLLIELVEGYLAIFPSKKERLWKPFFNQDSEKQNEMNNTCVSLFRNRNIAQAINGWATILESQPDHLYAFFNFSLGNCLSTFENPGTQIFMRLMKAKNSRSREYFKFLCKIRSRNFVSLKKHQIPNHLLFQDNQRNKIIDVMKFIESEKKNMKKIKMKEKEIKFQNISLSELYLCSCYIKECSQLVLVSNINSPSSLKIVCFNTVTGEKTSENTIKLLKNDDHNDSKFKITGNKEGFIVWNNQSVILIENTVKIQLLKEEFYNEIILVRFSDKNPKNFFLAQKDQNIKLLEFPTLKTLETLLIFSLENSKFSCLEILEDPAICVMLAQNEIIKFHWSGGSIPDFPKELKIKGKGPIKLFKFCKNTEKGDALLVLTSQTLELLPFSKKNSELMILQGNSCESLSGLIILESKNFILAYENDLTDIHFKLINITEPLLSQNLSVDFLFPGLPLLEEETNIKENSDLINILVLDKFGTTKKIGFNVSAKQTEIIKKIWDPEEVQFQDLEIDLSRNYYVGLMELIETWKNRENQESYENLFEIAENGKFFWDFKCRNEIKTIFLELNMQVQNSRKINESSEEAYFDDFTKISSFAFSPNNKLLAISEVGTKYIKIVEIDEFNNQIKLKKILEFDYGQNISDPHKENLLFSSSKIKKYESLLFHCYNDIPNKKCLGLVIWNISENCLLKKLEFQEKFMMETFRFSEKMETVYCFFQNGKCLSYDLINDDIFEQKFMFLMEPFWVIGFFVVENLGVTLCNDNLIRVYDLKNKNMVKILYLSGEAFVFWLFKNQFSELNVMDQNENLYQISGFSENLKLLKTVTNAENKKIGRLYFFDISEDKNLLVGVRDDNLIQILDLKTKKTLFKSSFNITGCIKAVYWLAAPSKIIIVNDCTLKIVCLFWEWK